MDEWNEIRRWRRALRAEHVARREAMDAEERRRCREALTELLVAGLPVLGGLVIGFCWPFRGEVDPRFAVRVFRERGAVAALPAVVDPRGPLEFRVWRPGVAMEKGVYDIPVPRGTPVVIPDALLAPMNAFDERGYRLGYGGGYFDRTLAAIEPRPLAIGISLERLRVPSIHPQDHDVPMDLVVTEAGIHVPAGTGLRTLSPAAAARHADALAAARGLPRRQPAA